ncbi:S24 family peptidase [Nitratidesulfovibrio liaohensis]|uniref:S24 family peptidase n=1 Tax=Nitratidesulfovibrio liaohensis TaxID=2604158 RepID=UPI00313310A8
MPRSPPQQKPFIPIKREERRVMRVTGESMEPDIKHNDAVLIDQSQRVPHPGLLYAVGVEDLVYLKSVNAEPGKLVLSSYNPDYPPIEVGARGDLSNGIRIIGRAVWVGRELN